MSVHGQMLGGGGKARGPWTEASLGRGLGAGSAEPLAGAALGLHYVWKQGNTTLPDRWYPFTFPAKSHPF